VAIDPVGNVFIADLKASAIFKIDHSTGTASVYVSFEYANAIALDPAGTLYISTGLNGNDVMKVDPDTLAVSIAAGTGTQGYGGDNGPATSANLNQPLALAVDSEGDLFIADYGNRVIRRVDAQTKTITTFAGTAGAYGTSGDGGPAAAAAFEGLGGLAIDGLGNVYVSDSLSNSVREIQSSTNFIWTIASNGNGTAPGGGTPIQGNLTAPGPLAVDAAGNIIVNVDFGIYEVNPSQQKSVSFAGGGGSAGPTDIGDGGAATSAFLLVPYGVAIDNGGNVYVADLGNVRIRKISIGSGVLQFSQTAVGQTSAAQTIEVEDEGNSVLNLSSVTASASFPLSPPGFSGCSSSTVLASGGNCAITVSFSPSSQQGTSGTLTVTSNSDNRSGTQIQAALRGGPVISITPASLSFGAQSLLIPSAPRALTITNTGTIPINLTGLSIDGANAVDFTETNNCPANPSASLNPGASCSLLLFFQPHGSGGRSATLTIADGSDPLPQTIPLTGTGGVVSGCVVTSFLAAPNPIISTTGAGVTTISIDANCSYDIRLGSSSGGLFASFSGTSTATTGDWVTDGMRFYLQPSGDTSAQDTLGTLTVRVEPTGVSSQELGSVPVNTSSTLVTVTLPFTGLSAAPSFSLRFGVEFSMGIPVCSGAGTCQIPIAFKPSYPGLREDALITRDNSGAPIQTTLLSGVGLGSQWGVTPGVISTLASGIGGTGVAVDPRGNLYVSDGVAQVNQVTPSGEVALIAGHPGTPSYGGDGGPAVNAYLWYPRALALDGAGNLYIADSGNNAIRKVDSITGIISTVAGVPSSVGGYTGDGGLATQATLNNPTDVALDRDGNILINDSNNSVVRRVDAITGIIATIAGTGTAGYSGDNGPASVAQLRYPAAIALDTQGDLFIGDAGNTESEYVRRVDATTGIITTIAGTPTTTGVSGTAADGGPATSATLGAISGLAIDSGGGLYLGDNITNLIRKVNTAGIIHTVAGISGGEGVSHAGDGGPATSAYLDGTGFLTLDGAGNLYFGDNSVARKISVTPAELTFVANVPGSPTSQTAMLSDIGNQALSIAGVSLRSLVDRSSLLRPGGFGQTNTCGASLSAGADCRVTVSYSPTVASETSDALLEFETSGHLLHKNLNPIISVTGYASAGPPCVVTSFYLIANASSVDGPVGSATVNVNADCSYDIRVGGPTGTLLAQGSGQGTFPTGNIVTEGLEFYLQKSGDTTAQGTLAIAIGTAGAGTCILTYFNESPGPSPYIVIEALAACAYDIREGSPNGTLVGQGNGFLSINVPAPVSNTLFYLQQSGNTSSSGTLAILTFSVSIPACVATQFYANPSPVPSSTPTGSTTINISTNCNWDLRSGGPGGSLLSSGSFGDFLQVPASGIVRKGTKFYLQQSGNTTPAGTISTLTVALVWH
jgi:hypothetical protein